MARDVVPTDPERETASGRIALWLDPKDLRWLSRHCCCPSDASQEQTERCARVRFRASAALHKAGLASEDTPPSAT
ncbi:MAG TPA: hypothetical protein VN688_02220 [Gemmataceae bacterium]|nr:hypothetical protein [Gemmataceae bacterium]